MNGLLGQVRSGQVRVFNVHIQRTPVTGTGNGQLKSVLIKWPEWDKSR